MNTPLSLTTLAAWLRHRTRHIWNRPSLSLAVAVFVLVYLAFVNVLSPSRALLLAFDIATASFIALTLRMMVRSTRLSMRQRALQQQEGRWGVLASSLLITMATMAALSLELHSKSGGSLLLLALSVSSLVLAWVFVNTLFALHYAHDYYANFDANRIAAEASLSFPGKEDPDYWDFMYFAFVLGMTFQVSDVQVTRRALRRFVLLHSVLAFFFNVVIIALTVNIIAGLG